MKRMCAWILVGASIIILYFNTGFYLNTAVSIKYEVDHPRMMMPDDADIRIRNDELNRNYYLAIGIYMFCVVAIGSGIYILSKTQT